MVAWGYLVWAAIDFGAEARGGNDDAWKFLVLASIGAVACLFLGLMLIARLLRAMGITNPPPKKDEDGTAGGEVLRTHRTEGATAGQAAASSASLALVDLHRLGPEQGAADDRGHEAAITAPAAKASW